MNKSNFFVLSFKTFFTNFMIVVLLCCVCVASVFGAQAITASKLVNGAYYAGDQNSNKITLMINVYWGTEYLEDMLNVLKENDVKTTFFVGGTWCVRESEMLKKIFEDGHEIANHGYSHGDHKSMTLEKNIEEISTTHKIVKDLIGVDMNLFAPPSGAYSKKTIQAANGLRYKVIMWTDGRDTIDWRDKDEELIYKRAIKNCHGGDFVLMHPTLATKNALDRIIKKLKNDGFELCTISQNLINV